MGDITPHSLHVNPSMYNKKQPFLFYRKKEKLNEKNQISSEVCRKSQNVLVTDGIRNLSRSSFSFLFLFLFLLIYFSFLQMPSRNSNARLVWCFLVAVFSRAEISSLSITYNSEVFAQNPLKNYLFYIPQCSSPLTVDLINYAEF